MATIEVTDPSPSEPSARLPIPWQWVRRAGLWAACDPRGNLVRSWSASDPTRLLTKPRGHTCPVPLAVYVAVAAANDVVLTDPCSADTTNDPHTRVPLIEIRRAKVRP